MRDFCTNVIEQLVKARTAVLWALRGKGQVYSVSEILKSFIQQALSLHYSSHTDLAFSFQLRRFLDVRFEEDYINLLVDILQHFKLIYIVFEAGVVKPHDASTIQHHLQNLSRALSDRCAKTVMKSIFLTYGPGTRSQQSNEHVVLKVERCSRRKGKKLPNKPLSSTGKSSRQLTGRVGSRPSQPLRFRCDH